MKKMTRYIGMAALALVGTVMMGCAESDLVANNNQQPKGNTVTLTSTISLDNSAGTRALGADGKKTFAKDDQIAILYKDANDKSQKVIATLKDTDISGDGKTAKITITLNSPKASGQLRCIYPAAMLSGDFNLDQNPDINNENTINFPSLFNYQDGTLTTIASNYDLAVYDGAFTSDAELPASITLKNQLAIVEFTIKDYDGNDITITNLEIEQGPGLFHYSVNREAAAGPIYVAMMPSENANEKITITATDGTTTLEKTARDVTLAASNIYPVTVTLLDMLHTPLTLEATVDGTTITVTNETGKTIQYQINGKNKISITNTENITDLKAGDIVQFFSTNASLADAANKYINIKPSKTTYVYGNVMSLIDDGTDGFANDKTIAGAYALGYLFYKADQLAFHDKKALVLPATTLADHCYEGMFDGCTGLTTVPDLPATTLGEYCYECMFEGCTGLTTLPEKLLPVETLAEGCYRAMFYKCTGLSTLPKTLLPAETLAESCYIGMFSDCTSLETALDLPAKTLAKGCYIGMFSNCSGLTKAPDLPATTLAEGCYQNMFVNCTSLNSVKCLATDISAQDCTDNWLHGAGQEATGEKNVYTMPEGSMTNGTWENDNDSGIPVGWTRVEITE